MRVYFFIIFILGTSALYGQNDLVEIYNARVFPCDSDETTLGINFCSGDKREYADSLLNSLYSKIMKSIDKETSDDKESLLRYRSKNKKTSEDKEMIQFLIGAISYTHRLKESIVRSQRTWIILRDQNEDAAGITCEGGTGCISMVNYAIIEDILDRIKKLQTLRSY